MKLYIAMNNQLIESPCTPILRGCESQVYDTGSQEFLYSSRHRCLLSAGSSENRAKITPGTCTYSQVSYQDVKTGIQYPFHKIYHTPANKDIWIWKAGANHKITSQKMLTYCDLFACLHPTDEKTRYSKLLITFNRVVSVLAFQFKNIL